MEWIEVFIFPNENMPESRIQSPKSFYWKGVRWSTLVVVRPKEDSVGFFLGFSSNCTLPSEWSCPVKFKYCIVDRNGETINEGKDTYYIFEDTSQSIDSRNYIGNFEYFKYRDIKRKVLSFPIVRVKVTFSDYQVAKGNIHLLPERAQFFMDKDTADVIIKVNDGGCFPAHKCILSARSEVFKTMLSCGMQESVSGEVLISEVDSATMKQFLRYLYTNVFSPSILNKMSSNLFALAHYYQVQDLISLCAAHMHRTLSNGNVTNCLTLAIKYELPLLKSACLKYIRQHKREIFQDMNYVRTLDDCVLRTILFMD